MSSSCQGLREDLIECVKASPCFQVEGSVRECLKDPSREDVPEQCKRFRVGYFECRRGWLDMRTRMRGNKGY